MRMNPYLRKPWKSKNKTRLIADFSLALIIGGGLSYFLITMVMPDDILGAAFSGAALFLVIFGVMNFCVCIRASRVQALNETIEDVSKDFVREVDQIIRRNQR